MPDRYDDMRAALPPSFLNYIEANSSWEGFLASSDEYIVLWDRESIQEHYEGYEMGEFLDPRWFPFGSNGGGDMLCFDLDSGNDAVYSLPFIGMSDEEPILQHESFMDLARRNERSA
jgi:hypothetical protein